ncbi:hypothetical protein JG688_00012144, partial [Phytophthora aleatoria]
YRTLDQSWNEGHKWQIKPAAPSLLERGLDDFFTKDYTAAVDSFTALLEAEKLSPAASIKVYWYRMVASLKLQKKEFFREDGDLLGKIDGCPKYFLEATKDVLGEDLTTIEATELAQYKALSPITDTKPRFKFLWSRQKRTLTLMERSEFAVKFCAIEFQKEKLLEATLTAKQSTENCLVCAVLNAKKDEVDMVQKYEAKPFAKKKPTVTRFRKATGVQVKEEGRKKKKPISLRISWSEDLLSSMDDIIKNEEEVDEAMQRGDSTQVKSEPVTASQEANTAGAGETMDSDMLH